MRRAAGPRRARYTATAIQTHSDAHRFKCAELEGDHGCHAVVAEPF
jgi:hypothetical protein